MPQNIGRFEVLRELGRGAQSIVYLGHDPHLQREVAIKTLHFAEADPQLNQLLLAEARTVSKLRHSNIVPIFEAGEEKGDPYLIFEYVDGGNLTELLREQPLSPVRAAEMTVAVLGALAHAHSQGIIHRDLKPSNILMDANGSPRVMDFGIAVRVTDHKEAQAEELMGTPAYMAPEYIENRTISERTDLFAVGLIMLEMLTGRRAVQANSIQQMLFQIVNKPIEIPPEANIDDRLGSIILTAVSIDPELRYENAKLMQQALTNYLDAVAAPTTEGAGDGAQQSTLDFLLRRMRHKSDFPALSDSVSAINKLTESDRESVNKLSYTILRDFALTNKVLRLVNSAYYRQVGGGSISTVSRAVTVLGFDAIRNLAITVLMFEHLQNKGHAGKLKEAFLRANLSGILARDIGQKLLPRDAEEVFICALFYNLGRLLAQYYFPEEVEQVRMLMQQKNCTEDAAVTQVLGITFEELGIGIAHHWGFPPAIVNCMRRLPQGNIKKPTSREESLRVIAGFSNELSDAIADSPSEDRHKAMMRVSARFSGCVPFSDEQMKVTLEKSFEKLSEVASVLHVNLKQSPFARQVKVWAGMIDSGSGEYRKISGPDSDLGDTVLEGSSIDGMTKLENEKRPGDRHDDSANPNDAADQSVDAQSIMAAGIQDISNTLVEDFALNDVLRIVLETMYRAMGFKRVLLCLRDPKSNHMVARFGFGPGTNEIVRKFRFPLGFAPDVFRASTDKGVDVIINDINDTKIMDRIPDWYRMSVPAETFVLFPLVIKSKPVALIYCDKDEAKQIVISDRELSLLKTLRNQAILAIKQSA